MAMGKRGEEQEQLFTTHESMCDDSGVQCEQREDIAEVTRSVPLVRWLLWGCMTGVACRGEAENVETSTTEVGTEVTGGGGPTSTGDALATSDDETSSSSDATTTGGTTAGMTTTVETTADSTSEAEPDVPEGPVLDLPSADCPSTLESLEFCVVDEVEAIVVADAESDGDLDILAYGRGSTSGAISILLQSQGDLLFVNAPATPVATAFSSNPNGTEFRTGDINADGNVETSVLSIGLSFDINGDEIRRTALAVQVTTPDGFLVQEQVLQDVLAVDGVTWNQFVRMHGSDDSLVGVASDGNLVRWDHDGMGRLVVGDTIPGIAADIFALEAADIDADGDPDVVALGVDAMEPVLDLVAWNNEAGELVSPPVLTQATDPFPLYNGTLRLGDADGDGLPDVLIAGANTISLQLGEGNGSFGSPVLTEVPTDGGELRSLDVADMNGDGRKDAVAVECGNAGGRINILLSEGAILAPPTLFNTPGCTFEVALGDMDGDEVIDVVVSHYDRDTVRILRGDGLGGVEIP